MEKSIFDKSIEKDENYFLVGNFSTLCGEKIKIEIKIRNKEIVDAAFNCPGARIFYIAGDIICKILLNKNIIRKIEIENDFWSLFNISLNGSRLDSMKNLINEVSISLNKLQNY